MSERLLHDVRSHLLANGATPSPASVKEAVRSHGHVVGSRALLDAVVRLRDDLVGFGPLQPLVSTDGVTDVLINGPDEVWIDRGRGLEKADVGFADEPSLRRLVQRLASAAGRRIDESKPYN